MKKWVIYFLLFAAVMAILPLLWVNEDLSVVNYGGCKLRISKQGAIWRNEGLSSNGRALYIVTFDASDGDNEGIMKEFEGTGAHICGVLPEDAAVVEVDKAAFEKIKQVSHFKGALRLDGVNKISQRLREKLVQNKEYMLTLQMSEGEKCDDVLRKLEGMGAQVVMAGEMMGRYIRARATGAIIGQIAEMGEVRFVEEYFPMKLFNHKAAEVIKAEPLRSVRGLTGAGQLVAYADSGLDSGVNDASLHPDFRGQVTGITNLNMRGDGYSATHSQDWGGHGTHVAGSLVGNGSASGGEIKGIAYGAKLYAICIGDDDGGDGVVLPAMSNLFEVGRRPNNYYCVFSESFGDEGNTAYSSYAEDIDMYTWEHPEFLPVVAAGNVGGEGTLSSLACSKNALTVGATESTTYSGHNPAKLTYFSSEGPCGDGRIKPDIVSPGYYIVSARSRYTSNKAWGVYSNTNYLYNSGTSMATPITAGASLLVREWLVREKGMANERISSALVKAILMGGAKDISTENGTNLAGCPTPSPRQGWGRTDVESSLFPENADVHVYDYVRFSSQSKVTARVLVTNTAPLRITMAYVDYPSNPMASTNLVNDLDLVVSNRTTGAVFYPNGLNGCDSLNNVESTVVATPQIGDEYDISVVGKKVFYPSTSGGAAALYINGAVEIVDDAEFYDTLSAECDNMSERIAFWGVNNSVPSWNFTLANLSGSRVGWEASLVAGENGKSLYGNKTKRANGGYTTTSYISLSATSGKIGAQQTQKLTVRFMGFPNATGTYTSTLVIRNTTTDVSQSFNLVLKMLENPSVLQQSVNFGTVTNGAVKTISVTIKNNDVENSLPIHHIEYDGRRTLEGFERIVDVIGAYQEFEEGYYDDAPTGEYIAQFSTQDNSELEWIGYYELGEEVGPTAAIEMTEIGHINMLDEFLNCLYDHYYLTEESQPPIFAGEMVGLDDALWEALTYSPYDERYYAASDWGDASTIYSFDLATRNLREITTIDGEIYGLAADRLGRLFALNVTDNTLQEIDTETGGILNTHPLGLELAYAQDIDFDPQGRHLYWVSSTIEGITELREIDPETGANRVIMPIEDGFNFDIAIAPSVSPFEATLGGLPITIPPNGTATLTLTFAPTSSGTKSAQLKFYTDLSANTSAILPISLQGTAVNVASTGVKPAWLEKYVISNLDDDSDGDGLTNYEEYLLHTSPRDPSSTFKITSYKKDTGIAFISVPDNTYALEIATELRGQYTEVERKKAVSRTTTFDYLPPAGTKQFYRIRFIPK